MIDKLISYKSYKINHMPIVNENKEKNKSIIAFTDNNDNQIQQTKNN